MTLEEYTKEELKDLLDTLDDYLLDSVGFTAMSLINKEVVSKNFRYLRDFCVFIFDYYRSDPISSSMSNCYNKRTAPTYVTLLTVELRALPLMINSEVGVPRVIVKWRLSIGK